MVKPTPFDFFGSSQEYPWMIRVYKNSSRLEFVSYHMQWQIVLVACLSSRCKISGIRSPWWYGSDILSFNLPNMNWTLVKVLILTSRHQSIFTTHYSCRLLWWDQILSHFFHWILSQATVVTLSTWIPKPDQQGLWILSNHLVFCLFTHRSTTVRKDRLWNFPGNFNHKFVAPTLWPLNSAFNESRIGETLSTNVTVESSVHQFNTEYTNFSFSCQ